MWGGGLTNNLYDDFFEVVKLADDVAPMFEDLKEALLAILMRAHSIYFIVAVKKNNP